MILCVFAYMEVRAIKKEINLQDLNNSYDLLADKSALVEFLCFDALA